MTHLSRPDSGSPRVLVFEPHVDTREMLVLALEASGSRVLLAPTRADARALASAEGVDACVIAVDSDPDDPALAAELRRDQGAEVRLIATTRYRSERERAYAAGFDAVLVKPFGLDRLLAKVAGRA
jgi:DNA-binding response OmpR family regulator